MKKNAEVHCVEAEQHVTKTQACLVQSLTHSLLRLTS